MGARLIDVAAAAGVSRSTASNVFNSPERVRPELRERVLAAARSLGYLGPDARGRLLRSGKFNTIGVMSPSDWGIVDMLDNPVFRLFLFGVGQACDERGASLVIVPYGATQKAIGAALVDGFIFGRVEEMAQIEPARLRDTPLVVVDFDPGPEVNSVRVDARAGAYAAAKHLLALGHRRFGILSFLRETAPARLFTPGMARPPGAAGMPTDQEKYIGYAQALFEAGIDIRDVTMVQAEPRDTVAAGQLLDAAPGITAVLAMSVMQGLAMLDEARRRGLSVPDDLSIVGYNDIAAAAQSSPPLTTVDGMGVEKGLLCGRMVLAGGEPRHEILQPRLILRASTAPAPENHP